ncbi:MAG: hypothetical protein IIW34_03415, partial [Clostridia bacterium]|nr:hypothetical protein [Clostridia bacterium]
LTAGLEGWLLRRCSIPERIALIAVAPLMLYPGAPSDFAGLAGFAAVLLYQKLSLNKNRSEI